MNHRIISIPVTVLLLLATAFTHSAPAADVPHAPPKKRVVGIVIYHGVEALDFAGPYEVFSLAHTHDTTPTDADAHGTATTMPAEQGMMGPMRRLFDVRVVATTTQPVAVSGGLDVVPTDSFDACPQVDVLVVPGGGRGGAAADKAVVAFVRRQAARAELITSVCTGAFVLGEAGLLDGKRSTTHHLSTDDLQAKYPKTSVVTGRRFVEDANVVTSAGVSAGIDMALHVVARLQGEPAARMTAGILEYPYPAPQAAARR